MPHIDLLELPYFAHIPLNELVSLIDAMQPRLVREGEPLVSSGCRVDSLFIVTAGRLTVAEGATARLCAAPLALPLRAFFAEADSPLEAVAVGPVSCFALSHTTFARLLAEHHRAIAPFLRNLLCLREGLAVG